MFHRCKKPARLLSIATSHHPSNERIATRHSHFAFPCNDCVNFEKRGRKGAKKTRKRKERERNEKKNEKEKIKQEGKKETIAPGCYLSPSLSLSPLHLCSSGVILERSERKEYRVGASDKSRVE